MKFELIKRILSTLILIPITFILIIKGSFFFNFFILICLLIALYEWHAMSKNRRYNIFGHIFLLFSFYSAYLIRNDFEKNSLFVFIFIILTCISTDIGGYVFGKIFKGPNLTKISPKKTYVGVFGSYFFSVICIYILFNNSEVITSESLLFGKDKFLLVLIISTVSQLGDITISYFKRLSNIKNTGKLVPGHGGILDRLDGMIFVFPFYYISNLLINF